MQPRDRTAVAYQAQIADMAANLEPERLGLSPEAGSGAPIVNEGGVVESGNGRVIALRRVFSDPKFADQAAAYRAFLEARGLDTTGMEAPVLVGRRITPLEPDAAAEFARGANDRSSMGMGTAEGARNDAARAGLAVADWQPGPLDGPGNAAFVASFMKRLPPEERASMLGADGRLSLAGEKRIRAALIAHAYGDALGPTLERVLNGDTDHMKGIAGALSDAAPQWAQMRDAARRGEIPAGLDISRGLGEAVQLLDRARATGTPVLELLAQTDLLGGPSPAAEALLRMMYQDPALRRPVTRASLGDLLTRYAEQAMQAQKGDGLFGPETSSGDILRAVGGTDAKVQAAADALVAGARADPTPEDTAVAQQAEAAQRAPVGPSGSAIEALADAQRQQASAEELIAAQVKAGRIDADDPAIAEARDAGRALEEQGRAMEAAANCMVGR
jgi:hypothetical protein